MTYCAFSSNRSPSGTMMAARSAGLERSDCVGQKNRVGVLTHVAVAAAELGLLRERIVGEDDVVSLFQWLAQGVHLRDVGVTIARQDHVHLGHLGRSGQFPAEHGVVLESVEHHPVVSDFSLDVLERIDEKSAGAAARVVDRLAVPRVDQVNHQPHDVPRSEVLAEIVADSDRVFEEVLECVALHVGVRVEEPQPRKVIDDRLERLRCLDEQFLLEHVSAVVVLVAEPAEHGVVDVVEHVSGRSLAELGPAIAPVQIPGIPVALPLVFDLADELQEKQVREFSEPLDPLTEPFIPQQIVRLGEHVDEFLAGDARRH